MIRLSALADEISPDLDEQTFFLRGEGIGYLELRSAWNTNVLDLTRTQLDRIRRTLDATGIGVSAIGSPIGKVPVDSPRDEHLARFEQALALAQEFNTQYVRLFSFYPPAGLPDSDHESFREEVISRLQEMANLAQSAGVTLLHENEKDIYGDTIARCVDLLASVDSAHFQAVLDPANFVQCGQRPYPDAYEALKPWLAYVHVKDARADGTVTVAGEGAACWPDLLARLRADGYDGFFSLEPHLAAAGRLGGFSGADLFRTAVRAFRAVGH